MKKIVSIVLALCLTAVLAVGACAETEKTIVKVGVVGENNEQWAVINTLLADDGIEVELVKFADYAQPNQALADGEIELNAFQHYAFLNDWMQKSGFELTVIGDTLLAPLGIYSTKITSLDELKDGDNIGIMNDATNEGRAIKIMAQAGLITLQDDSEVLPELSDIAENPLNLQFIEVEAAQTPLLLEDVTCAFINGGHAVDAGFVPEKDALFLESQTSSDGTQNPYVNIIVARPEDATNETYLKIVEAYHTPEVAQVFAEHYAGAYLPAWDVEATTEDTAE